MAISDIFGVDGTSDGIDFARVGGIIGLVSGIIGFVGGIIAIVSGMLGVIGGVFGIVSSGLPPHRTSGDRGELDPCPGPTDPAHRQRADGRAKQCQRRFP